MESNIRSLIEDFVDQLAATIEAESVRRVQEAVAGALAAGEGAARSKLSRAALAPAPAVRRRPKQFCPVPGCTGVAAPVFGMVCVKHKDLPKTKIKEYRDQRRASKAGKK